MAWKNKADCKKHSESISQTTEFVRWKSFLLTEVEPKERLDQNAEVAIFATR